jgi:5-methylcytosine-specific restriction protein A
LLPKQRELLLVHHRAQARVTSATRLAEVVGFENYNAVNLQYGLLGRDIANQLGIELTESVAVGVLVDFVDPGVAANEHYLWVLRPNVAQALEDLGWAPRVSHLLYPELALMKAHAEALPQS